MVEVSRVQALERVLRQATGEPLVILLSGHPDPDAIGSALAHRKLCAAAGVPATIAHVRHVSHRQNRALVKLLGIEMLHARDGADLQAFQHLSLVDTSSPEPSIELPQELRTLTVVDHHRGERVDAPFVDVRTSIGATSSIYAEYLANGSAPLAAANADDTGVATALLFGIQTDTDDFALATAADFEAAAYLKPHCDLEVLKRVGRRVVSATAMEVLGRAVTNLCVVRDFAAAGVGWVDPGYRDTIGAAADYVLRREDIDTVVVFGIVGNRIDGSLRTNSASVDPAGFLESAFGRAPDGRPYGGGRAEKGAFQVPLGMLGESRDDALWRIVEALVFARLARIVPELEREYAARGGQSSAAR